MARPGTGGAEWRGREREEPNGEGQNRTGDTTIFSRVLYQLSYLAATGAPKRAAHREG
jgi:hypothetical protein